MNRTVTIESRNHKYANQDAGIICQSDFNTEYEGNHNMVDRIITSWKIDKQYRKESVNE